MVRLTPGYESSDEPRGPRLAKLADRQHGVIAWQQLLDLGFSRSQIVREVDAGRLHRIHRGVYAVGRPTLSRRGHWMAAVLAVGTAAVLSHRSAWALHGIGPGSGRLIDVTRPGRGARAVAGVRVHASRTLADADVTIRDDIPVTTVERTLLDLADVLTPQRLRLAFEDADRLQLIDGRALRDVLSRARGRHGAPDLAVILDGYADDAPWTQSEFERQFLILVREHGLPMPRFNVLLHGELVDCLFPEGPLVVELDGYRFHRGRASFERDRRRDAKLLVHGVPVLRLTQRRIAQEPSEVARTVLGALARLRSNLL